MFFPKAASSFLTASVLLFGLPALADNHTYSGQLRLLLLLECAKKYGDDNCNQFLENDDGVVARCTTKDY